MENNKIEIKISRQGVCMGDDISKHYMDISIPLVDCFTIEELLKIIDIWLINYGNITWKVTTEEREEIGIIKIEDKEHKYETLTKKKLTEFNKPIHIICRKEK
ncbi:MAG: hypothetical protein E7311_04250 [Clostridiales bacterium]|nr:hypothetical protein [Clostridiales bacterium]